MDASDRTLLILDLDETLIHACHPPLDYSPLFVSDPYSVYPRPFVGDFLRGAAGLFQLAVWSSAREDYVAEVVEHVFPKEIPLAFVWARRRCTVRRKPGWGQYPYHVKDLKKVHKLGYDLRRVLVVDDTPQKLERHYGNAIYVQPFEGSRADDELPRLLAYLKTLSQAPNVRTIEKRGWRNRTGPELPAPGSG